TQSSGDSENIRVTKRVSKRIAARELSTQPRLQIGLEVPGKSVARVVFEDGFLVTEFNSQFLHFCINRALNARADGAKDAPRGVITHLLNARLVNARVNINPEVVITCGRVNIDEGAPIVDDSVSECELHHSLLKFDIRVVVKRPGRIAGGRQLCEKSVAENSPLPLSHFRFGHDSPVKMLDHGQRVVIDVSVKALHANSAVHAQAPQVGFKDE